MKKSLKSNCFKTGNGPLHLFNLFLLNLIFFTITSCTGIKSFGKFERRWIYKHPIAALKLKKLKRECDVVYKEVKNNNVLDTYENGGKLDAFRHMFYTTIFAYKISPKKIRKLGIAHEKDNYLAFLKNIDEEAEMADSLSCAMDLLNNEIGIELAKSIRGPVSIRKIKELCIEKINSGQSYFMKRNSIGNYLTCEGEIINFNLYIKKWNVPKCLVTK